MANDNRRAGTGWRCRILRALNKKPLTGVNRRGDRTSRHSIRRRRSRRHRLTSVSRVTCSSSRARAYECVQCVMYSTRMATAIPQSDLVSRDREFRDRTYAGRNENRNTDEKKIKNKLKHVRFGWRHAFVLLWRRDDGNNGNTREDNDITVFTDNDVWRTVRGRRRIVGRRTPWNVRYRYCFVIRIIIIFVFSGST